MHIHLAQDIHKHKAKQQAQIVINKSEDSIQKLWTTLVILQNDLKMPKQFTTNKQKSTPLKERAKIASIKGLLGVPLVSQNKVEGTIPS